MIFFLLSFVAGILTVLAPCVLPLLPVIIGSSISSNRKSKPYIIAASLSISIILFTFVLKVSTAFIYIPPFVWNVISGSILIIFGLVMLFPNLYEKVTARMNLILGRSGNRLIAEGVKKESVKGDILIGAALGPVFSTCSPTYFVILATVLPASFLKGFIYLLAYTIGLSLMLLLISVLGQKLVMRLENASNPNGPFKRILAVLFILIGIFVISGLDKRIQALVVSNGVFDITRFETKLLEKTSAPRDTSYEDDTYDTEVESEDMKYVLEAKRQTYEKYKEIKDPAGFVNSEPFRLKDYIGKKVILLDVMTYSCINCQRTFPYLKSWYETYEKEGLLIVGIHTPEFAFEKNIENVEAAMKQFGLTFPVVLDNDYSTWNAYGNNVWPRKYLIDIDGFIVYDHKGEGAYEEMEKKIQDLLREKAQREGVKRAASEIKASDMKVGVNYARSPETYFGALRNTNFASGEKGRVGEKDYMKADDMLLNQLYFSGRWDIQPEYARALRDSRAYFNYNAAKIFAVASSEKGGQIEVYKDGKYVRTVDVKDAMLYTFIDDALPYKSLLELKVEAGVDLYTFTFG